jgi:hypothetical protein
MKGGILHAAASPLGSLTPAEPPLIEAEKLFRQPAPALNAVQSQACLQRLATLQSLDAYQSGGAARIPYGLETAICGTVIERFPSIE